MAGNFGTQVSKVFVGLFIIWIPLTYTIPAPASDNDMVHNGNYDMIMLDDHEPAESMHFQNFDNFFNAETAENDAMAEMQMEESQVSVIHASQPLKEREKYLRQYIEELDAHREKHM